MVSKEAAANSYVCLGMDEEGCECKNMVNFSVAYDIVEKIGKLIEEDVKNYTITDYRNARFKVKNHEVKILKYNNKEIHIGVLNNGIYISNRGLNL